MRRTIITGASLAIGALTILSLYINFRFGWELGKNAYMLPWFHDGYIWGAASVALDLLKILLPVLIAGALMARGHSLIMRGLVALGLLAMWAPITAYSFNSAFGTALKERHDNKGSRASTISTEERLRSERTKLLAKNPWTAETVQYKQLPSSAIEQQIAGMKANPIWQVSEECTEPRGKTSQSWCQLYATATIAKEIALGQERAEARIAQIDAALSKSAGVTVADPNAAALASITGFDEGKVLTGWALFLALLLEAVPNVGPALFWMALKLLDNPKPRKEATPPVLTVVKPDPTVPALAPAEPEADNDNVVELRPHRLAATPVYSPEAIMDDAIRPLNTRKDIYHQDVLTKANEIAMSRGHVAIDPKALAKRLNAWGFYKLKGRTTDSDGTRHTVYRWTGGGHARNKAA